MYNVYCNNELVAENVSEKSMMFLVNHYDRLKIMINRDYKITVKKVS
jgi:hypothetical protein